MRPLLCFVFLCLLQQSIYSQTISGIIKDGKNKPIPNASVTLKDTYDGATSDSTGFFSFPTTEKGKLILVITAVGYKPYEQEITVAEEPMKLDVSLKEEITELKAVVISAGSFEASDKGKTTVLNSIDIATTAGGNADITGALKTLPGAQQVGESEGLFVRGGTAAETKTFIDGTLVNNYFFSSVPNIAQRGRFSPFLFKGTVFSTGGYSALYGQALSSALILESIDLPERNEASLGVSVIGLNGGIQRLAKNKKSSFGFSYGYTNLWPAFKVIKQRQDFFQMPVYHTADANFRIKTSKTGMIKYYGYFSANKLGFRNNSIDSLGYKDVFELANTNMYHNLSWKENLGKRWWLQLGGSYANNRDDIASSMDNANDQRVLLQGLEFKQFDVATRGHYFNAKAVLEKRFKGLTAIRFGSEYNYSKDKTDYTMYNGMEFKQAIEENINSFFAETDIYVTNDLAAKLGTRVEHSSYFNKWNAAPRVSLAYKVSKFSQASLAYGIFYQNPERRYLPAFNQLDFSRADHYIAQYQMVSTSQTLRMEVFYKKYHDLVKTAPSNGGQLAAVNNNGFGDAKGFELFWRDKKTIKDMDYWISYSYLDTKRDFINFPQAIRPNFAAKHTASLVMKKFVTKWKTGFNMSYSYASPRPYYNIYNDAGTNKFSDQGETPSYHNVSFSLNYLPNLFKKDSKAFGVWVLSVSNIFGIKQVYGYTYSYNNYRKDPIVPPSRSFVFIGYFLSFGTDRTQDAINSNL